MSIGRFAGTFRMISDKLWLHPGIEFFDLGLWCALSFCARGRDRCTATDASLAEMLGVSIPTVQRGLRRLEAASFITRETTAEERTVILNSEGDGQPVIFELKTA